jgi:hypothetical protein
MAKLKLSTAFSINVSNEAFILNLRLLGGLDVLINYQKDAIGNYHIYPSGGLNTGIWSPLPAGLAVIYNFLDYQITEKTRIIIKRVEYNEITNEKIEKETIEKLEDQEVEVNFSNQTFENVPAELQKGALKFYLLEKMLNDICIDDIKDIGYSKLIPRDIELKYITKRKIKFDKERGKEVIRYAGFDFDKNIFYSVDFIKKDKIRIFFQSDIEEKEKVIKILYCIGIDCENTKQRIRKNKTHQLLFDTGRTISYCSDWEINTIGENKLINDMATQVAKNLAIFLDVSEKFIRAKEFDVLWDMCRAST